MKKVLMVVVTLMALLVNPVASFANHHEEGNKGEMMTMKMEQMTEELGLSEEQAATIKMLMEEKHAKKEAAVAEFKTKMMEVLTPEQAETYEVMKGECTCGKGEGECKVCALKAKKEKMMDEKGSMMKKGSGHDEHKGSH